MAKRLKGNGADKDDLGIGHNVNEIKKIISDGVREIIGHEARIAGIRAEIKEVRGGIKGAGIKMKDFAVAKRLYELEGDERHEALDNIRLCCEALGVGVQGDLFPTPAEVAGADARV